MDAEFLEKTPPKAINGRDAERTATARAVSLLHRDGQLPVKYTGANGLVFDPSPLAKLTRRQRMSRLVGLLELFASYGDPASASAALSHHRWAEEMSRGKAPSREAVTARKPLTVRNSLASAAGTPIPEPTGRHAARPS